MTTTVLLVATAAMVETLVNSTKPSLRMDVVTMPMPAKEIAYPHSQVASKRAVANAMELVECPSFSTVFPMSLFLSLSLYLSGVWRLYDRIND